MNKPGSHRGSNSTKKKKFTRGEMKKKPITLVDKLREYILEFAECVEKKQAVKYIIL